MKRNEICNKLMTYDNTKVNHNINESETVRAALELRNDLNVFIEGIKAHIFQTYGENHTFYYQDDMMVKYVRAHQNALVQYTDADKAKKLIKDINDLKKELEQITIKVPNPEYKNASLELTSRHHKK